MAKPAPAATYQYHIEEVPDVLTRGGMLDRLNALGKDGWYLVEMGEANPATQRRQLLFVRYGEEK